MLMERQTDKKQTELHQFRKQPSLMVIYLPVQFEIDWTKSFRVRVWKRKC